MDIKRNQSAELELLTDMYQAMYEPDRSQPSVSGMIYCLTKTFYENEMVTPNVDGSLPSHRNERQLLLFASGLGLEKVLLAGKQVSASGVYEGISWHADHIGNDNSFYEIKSTRKRTPREDETAELDILSEGWRKQILAYFKVSGLISGRLAVLHLMGDYKPPFPQLRVYEMQASQDEIDDNWAWILSRARLYEQFVESGQPPEPFKYNEPWECENCNWKALCEARSMGTMMGSAREV